jgi:hypothetical protein
MMRSAIRLVSILALALCSACTRFDNPIVGKAGPALDSAVVGRWEFKNDKGTMRADIVNVGGVGHLVTTMLERGKPPEIDEYRLITATLEQMKFASIRSLGHPDASWVLFRYELPSPDLMVVYGDDPHFWRESVSNQQIAGSVEQKDRLSVTTVTASEAEMRACVLGYGSVIFNDDDPKELRRVPAR